MEQKPIRFEQTLPVGEIPFDSEFKQQAPLTASGIAELHVTTEELRVRGRLQVSLLLECDRCTEPFTQNIEEEFDLIYLPSPETSPGAEIAIGPNDSHVGFYDGPGLELNDILQEQVLLALPLQRLCRADCQGICPICGQNRNETECHCQRRITDERWSALRKL
ncbi:MAG: YceD family protein [Bryobacteraceae bacterium]